MRGARHGAVVVKPWGLGGEWIAPLTPATKRDPPAASNLERTPFWRGTTFGDGSIRLLELSRGRLAVPGWWWFTEGGCRFGSRGPWAAERPKRVKRERTIPAGGRRTSGDTFPHSSYLTGGLN